MAYSSKYYDPAKAHDYYMAHRNLKGRKKSQRKYGSTAGMTDEGKEIAKYVKEQIMEEKKQVLETISNSMKSAIENMRSELKSLLEGKSKEEKARLKAEYKEKIAEIRGQYKEWKKSTREAFTNKYKGEVERMQASGEYKKGKKK